MWYYYLRIDHFQDYQQSLKAVSIKQWAILDLNQWHPACKAEIRLNINDFT